MPRLKRLACEPCRQRKRKCDGSLPCSTCLRSRSGPSVCVYSESFDITGSDQMTEETIIMENKSTIPESDALTSFPQASNLSPRLESSSDEGDQTRIKSIWKLWNWQSSGFGWRPDGIPRTSFIRSSKVCLLLSNKSYKWDIGSSFYAKEHFSPNGFNGFEPTSTKIRYPGRSLGYFIVPLLLRSWCGSWWLLHYPCTSVPIINQATLFHFPEECYILSFYLLLYSSGVIFDYSCTKRQDRLEQSICFLYYTRFIWCSRAKQPRTMW